MYVSDRLVFVDLPKTASSHVRRLLARLEPGREVGVHVRAGSALRHSDREFWGTIRNPWDWYVSLWAYGCGGRGTLHGAVTSDLGWLRARGWKHAPVTALRSLLANPRRHRDAWRASYANAGDPACFRRWLTMVHDPAFAGDLGDAYAPSGLANDHGLLTWRYLRLYCDALPRPSIDPAALQRFDDAHCYITRFLRTDRLADDLEGAFEALGRPLDAEERRLLQAGKPSNPSVRERDPGFYYDAETIDLVARRDALLVRKFAFDPPPL